ncbi:MAG: hypothetical protein H6658_08535 [Ardenticatenaceae bacterium]|nr:hypothetical protein [Ardenticatenaceae bacterium]
MQAPPCHQFTQGDGQGGQNSYPTCGYFGVGTAVCGKSLWGIRPNRQSSIVNRKWGKRP